jgi:hypothetical protein
MSCWLLLFALGQAQAAPEEKKKAELSVDRTGAHLLGPDYRVDLAGRYVFMGRFVEQRPDLVSGPDGPDIFRESGWYTRQARIELSAEYRETWEFRVSADLVSDTLGLADGYVGYIGLPYFKIRVGQMKVPLGIELMDSFLYTTMAERSIATSILPGRELGAMAWGCFPIFALRMNEWAFYQVMTGKGSLTEDENKSVGARGPSDDELNFMVQMYVLVGKMIDSEWTKNARAGFFHEVGLGADLPFRDIRLPDTGTKIMDFDNDENPLGPAGARRRLVFLGVSEFRSGGAMVPDGHGDPAAVAHGHPGAQQRLFHRVVPRSRVDRHG